jgi:hypothetical protein
MLIYSQGGARSRQAWVWCSRYSFLFGGWDKAATSCSCDRSVSFDCTPDRIAFVRVPSMRAGGIERDAIDSLPDPAVEASTAGLIVCAQRRVVKLGECASVANRGPLPIGAPLHSFAAPLLARPPEGHYGLWGREFPCPRCQSFVQVLGIRWMGFLLVTHGKYRVRYEDPAGIDGPFFGRRLRS